MVVSYLILHKDWGEEASKNHHGRDYIISLLKRQARVVAPWFFPGFPWWTFQPKKLNKINMLGGGSSNRAEMWPLVHNLGTIGHLRQVREKRRNRAWTENSLRINGGGAWESNPPGTLFTPPTGFEVQETHQDLSTSTQWFQLRTCLLKHSGNLMVHHDWWLPHHGARTAL